MTSRLRIGLVLAAAAFTACQSPPPATPTVKTMDVNGARLAYVEQGQGAPVVFVHGAVSDYRTWNRQRESVARHYRAISYSQRYFGSEPWSDDWPKFSINTHAADLAAFIRGLRAGPVHVVGWSYGASVGLALAQQNPELVKSAFLFEPAHATYVTDPADLKAITDDRANFAPIGQAVKAGDSAAAARAMLDAVDDRSGVLQTWSPEIQAVVLENARTMPLMIAAQQAPSPISCAQLGQIAPPVAILRGELSRPYFRIIADTAARCIAGGRHMVVPKGRHLWPGDDPQGFSETLIGFLMRQ